MDSVEDILELAPDTHSATLDGTRVLFRAYVAADKTERLVWRIGDTTGNEATLDKLGAVITLPQGREIILNGRQTHYINIPRWLADALMNDFDEFETTTVSHGGVSESNRPRYKAAPSETGEAPNTDEEFTPMFEDDETDLEGDEPDTETPDPRSPRPQSQRTPNEVRQPQDSHSEDGEDGEGGDPLFDPTSDSEETTNHVEDDSDQSTED